MTTREENDPILKNLGSDIKEIRRFMERIDKDMDEVKSDIRHLKRQTRDLDEMRDELVGTLTRMMQARDLPPDSGSFEARGYGLIEPRDRFRKRPRFAG